LRGNPGISLPGFEAATPVDAPLPKPSRKSPPGLWPPPEQTSVGDAGADQPPFTVRLVRSGRRKSTVGASLTGTVLTVTVPSTMSDVEAERWTAEMGRRFARKVSTQAIDLRARATALSRRYDLPRAREIRWGEMTTRWGSCTIGTAAIRISTRMAGFPSWVIDYVIVHELAHLEVPDHSPKFWKVVDRYPKAERARGYLIAKAGEDSDADEPY
jgi:hypothetical protein